MQQSQYNIFRLANGQRCVVRQAQGATFCGLVVGAGSRNDPANRHGLAHFVEHTIFKGTAKRTSSQIANRLELVGGELNAYTSKEETVVYAVTPGGYTDRALELLADITRNSIFPQKELDKEREVIIDEINLYLDNPSERVFDEFDDMIYSGSSLGHNILGTPQSVRSIESRDCLAFIRNHYGSDNTVIYCVSADSPDKTRRLIEKYFDGSVPTAATESLCPPTTPATVGIFDEVHNNGGHQAHTIMGSRVFGRNDNRRYALFLLNNMLGGPGMNSRFNQELRDRRGYVYTVDSNVALMSDCGLWQVYFGCNPDDVDKCRRLITREISRIAHGGLTERALERAKRQYLGQLQLSAEHKESRAISMGKSVLYYAEIIDIDRVGEMIRAVTLNNVSDMAGLLIDNGLYRLTLT